MGGRPTPSVSSQFGSKLPLPLYADVRLHVSMTRRNGRYMADYPKGLKCLGGPNASNYDLAPDVLFIKYIVARFASFRNVWWSMSNEWNQCSCKWADAGIDPCPNSKDYSDPGCGEDGLNSPAL